MATVSNNETAGDCRESTVTDHSDIENRALDEVFAEMSTIESPHRPVNRPVRRRADPCRQEDVQVEIALPRRERVSNKPDEPHKPDWTGRFLRGFALCCALLGAVFFYHAMPSSRASAAGSSSNPRRTGGETA